MLALERDKLIDAQIDQVERIKPAIRPKMEHPFGMLKQQFGHGVRYWGLKKNTAQIVTLVALSTC